MSSSGPTNPVCSSCCSGGGCSIAQPTTFIIKTGLESWGDVESVSYSKTYLLQVQVPAVECYLKYQDSDDSGIEQAVRYDTMDDYDKLHPPVSFEYEGSSSSTPSSMSYGDTFKMYMKVDATSSIPYIVNDASSCDTSAASLTMVQACSDITGSTGTNDNLPSVLFQIMPACNNTKTTGDTVETEDSIYLLAQDSTDPSGTSFTMALGANGTPCSASGITLATLVDADVSEGDVQCTTGASPVWDSESACWDCTGTPGGSTKDDFILFGFIIVVIIAIILII